MRRVIHAILAGSLTFGVVAAAASGATFGLTIEDIVRVGTGAAAASVTVVERECDGVYEIFWETDGATIIGFSAYRDSELVPDDGPDDGLAFCAGQPFVLQVSDGMDGWIWKETVDFNNEPFLLTDENGGILAAKFVEIGGIQFDDGDQVRLVIGPDAATF